MKKNRAIPKAKLWQWANESIGELVTFFDARVQHWFQ
jgi:hypothetical protein